VLFGFSCLGLAQVSGMGSAIFFSPQLTINKAHTQANAQASLVLFMIAPPKKFKKGLNQSCPLMAKTF
jgi:hypothetical protein